MRTHASWLVLWVGLAMAAVMPTAGGSTASPAAVQTEQTLENLLRPGHSAADEMTALALVRAARNTGFLAEASRVLFDTGRYQDVVGRFVGPLRGAFQTEMALGRPLFVDPHVNDATDAEIRRVGLSHGMRYDCLIVPGYTPTDANPTDPIHPTAVERCRRAADHFAGHDAPFVIVTGGNVYPSGTPQTEAILLRDELVRRGVPANRILVEAYARHSTTNLRNSARLMLDRGLRQALIVTSSDQSFYFSWAWISTFHFRCVADLGYRVGALSFAGAHETKFQPSDATRRTHYAEPLDW